MRFWRWMLCCAALTAVIDRANAAVSFTTTHAPGGHDLDAMMSNSDLLHGLIATELPGDLGWHNANPASTDSMHPWGLPAFTDGLGTQGDLYGLLNDNFPPAVRGEPVKLVQYDLAGLTNITGINIFSGNVVNADGRIFSTTVVRYSTNNGESFADLGYFQSDQSGTINNESNGAANMATMVSIFDDAAQPLIEGVTNLQFNFYAVDNTGGEMRDPFGSEDAEEAMDDNLPININPYTGLNDRLTSAFVSPLVWEIDVIGTPGVAANADFDGDGDVDGADFLAWQRGLGTTGNATRQQGDSDNDQDVDSIDLATWRTQFGTGGSISAVPEPATGAGLILGMITCLRAGRRWRSEAAWRRARDARRS